MHYFCNIIITISMTDIPPPGCHTGGGDIPLMYGSNPPPNICIQVLVVRLSAAMLQNYTDRVLKYRIAGNFRGTKYSWFSNIETFRG